MISYSRFAAATREQLVKRARYDVRAEPFRLGSADRRTWDGRVDGQTHVEKRCSFAMF